ncbi:MAG: hypothetical protein HY896_13420 [Deltaproteobacteria bacterium]|nr:hypothetical protein [Deltaproteobacteria bacterium]
MKEKKSCTIWKEKITRFAVLSLYIVIAFADLIINVPPTAAQADVGLSQEDLKMANAVIAENTITLRLPGLGTSVDGPGPLTNADRLVLLALKFHEKRKALVPFGEMKRRLGKAESRSTYRLAGEKFWAWYREAAGKGQAGGLGGLKGKFGTYIAMKNTEKRKAANRKLGAHVQSEAAWRKAMESDARFREKVSSRADIAAEARSAYLKEWHIQNEKEAAAAQMDWEAAMALFPWRSN